MHYEDLSPFRDFFLDDNYATIYPDWISIGWLDAKFEFPKGNANTEFVQQLKDLLFNDHKNSEDREQGRFKKETAVVNITEATRNGLFRCPFCPEEVAEIRVEAEGLRYYEGSRPAFLGCIKYYIPGLNGTTTYVFPNLLYHYVSVHNYLPPSEFVEAILNFDLTKHFDGSAELPNSQCAEVIKVPPTEAELKWKEEWLKRQKNY